MCIVKIKLIERSNKMSYDVSLVDPVSKKVIEISSPHFMFGGNVCIGGTQQLSLNITYNYGDILRHKLGNKGIHTLYGKTGLESIPILETAVKQLADDVDDADYWHATEGNVKRALNQLLVMARMRPDGIWDGD